MLLIAVSVLVQSCGKDNLSYPSSTVKGQFTYQGQPVGLVYSNPDIIGTAGVFTSQLLFQQVKGAQEKYSVGDEALYAKHDGTFTGKFFNGEYLARTSSGRNPFEDFSNKTVVINGDTDLGNMEVLPNWWLTGLAHSYNAGVFTANFTLTRPSAQAGRTLQQVIVYFTSTRLADDQAATLGVARPFTPGTNAGGVLIPASGSTGGAGSVRVDLNAFSAGEKAN